MFKCFLLACVILQVHLGAARRYSGQLNRPVSEVVSDKANEVGSDEKVSERESDLVLKEPAKESSGDGNELCQSMARQGYEKCKAEFKQITRSGEQNSRRICCALKTLQQCVLPIINKYCSLEAFNDIEKDLHGANYICRVVGSRYCPKTETLERLRLDPKDEFELL